MRKHKQIDSFTFLRAIFIIAICIFHSSVQILPGGFMAVIGFFVMSGFLMMKKLNNIEDFNLKELKINIQKRFLKLMPSLIFVISTSLIIALIFSKIIFHDSIKASIPSALSFQNLYQIFKGGSYFTKNGYFSIFTHFWYISMQIQFILIFYLINYFLDKFKDKFTSKEIRIYLFGLISVISILLMIIFSFDKNNISRIYYGPDTRINAIFIGAITYLLVDDFSKIIDLSKEKNFSPKYVLYALLFLSFILYFFINGENLYTYRIIIPIYTLIQALLIGILYTYEKESIISINKKEMGFVKTILYYIGLRSYYIYMWQYIINTFISYAFAHTTKSRILAYILEIFLVLILSEITYIIFQKKFDLKKYFIISAVIILSLNVLANFIPNPKAEDMKNLEKRISDNKENIKKNNEKFLQDQKKKENKNKLSNSNEKDKDKKENDNKKSEKKEITFEKKAYDDFNFTEKEREFLKNTSITAIGDSVLINIDPFIREFNPNLYLDGEVGRQMTDGPKVLQDIKNKNGLGNIILVSLGSNGTLSEQNMLDILNISEGRKVFFVNTVNSQSWEGPINTKIKKFCDENQNAYMVDWYKFAKEKANLFAKDMVHPEVEGSKAYRNLIEREIINSFAK
ncbi:acyltransferase family protein [Anaerococcus rubeinfantis]|uniref:acyltransferase family protein n=1 Tax=Anaerococcus rubeinfantis TaxID=1720199 RepID=UPI00073E4AB8|nr:acyltransferase family protein [Anaerococcus rubeinfantis]